LLITEQRICSLGLTGARPDGPTMLTTKDQPARRNFVKAGLKDTSAFLDFLIIEFAFIRKYALNFLNRVHVD